MLPDEAACDPVLTDFRSFLDRDPHLTGFTGFRLSDFSPGERLLDSRLQRFCNRLVARDADPVFAGAEVQRKRDGWDYDILLAQQFRLVGNIGLASWDQDGLYAKLVVGWRSRWQTDRVLASAPDPERLRDLLRGLARSTRLIIHAKIRPCFHRFYYPIVAQWERMVDDVGGAAVAWGEAVEFARRFHGKPLDEQRAAELGCEPCKVMDEPALKRALGESELFCAAGLAGHVGPKGTGPWQAGRANEDGRWEGEGAGSCAVRAEWCPVNTRKRTSNGRQPLPGRRPPCAAHRSLGCKPVCFAMRLSIRGPSSSLS